MDLENSLILSAEEICVLSGILGYHSVIGVSADMTADWKRSVKSRISTVTSRLERRKLIRIGLEGRIFVRTDVHRAIDCLCVPERFLLIVNGTKRIADREEYRCCLNGSVLRLKHISDSDYSLCFIADPGSRLFDGLIQEPAEDICVEASKSDMFEIRKYINNFESPKAEDSDGRKNGLLKKLQLAESIDISGYIVQNRLYRRVFTKKHKVLDKTLYEVVTGRDTVKYITVSVSYADEEIMRFFREV